MSCLNKIMNGSKTQHTASPTPKRLSLAFHCPEMSPCQENGFHLSFNQPMELQHFNEAFAQAKWGAMVMSNVHWILSCP